MFHSPRVIYRKTTLAACSLGLLIPCSASTQVISAQLAETAPVGLRTILPSDVRSIFGPSEVIKGGFAYGVGLHALYDSNFFLTENNPKSEFSTYVMPWLHYASDADAAAPFSFAATYQPNLRFYQHNADLNGVDQSGGITLKAEGSKTVITANLDYNMISGTDRLSGTFVTASMLAVDLRGTYQVAPRTSLFALWRLGMSDYGSSNLVGSANYTTEIGALWSATERFSFGPSFTYTSTESDNTGTRDTWALSMQTRYLMGTKIHLIASLGLQSSTNSRDNGSATSGLTGDLAVDYAINENLSWVNSVQYVTVPSPTDVNYVINHLSLSTALSRRLLLAEVTIGLEMSVSDYVEVGPVRSQLNQQNNLSAVIGYSRKLFLDRVDFDSSIRYALSDGRYDWSQLQISAGFKVSF